MSGFIPTKLDAKYAWYSNFNSSLKIVGPQINLPQASIDGYAASYTTADAKRKAVQDAKTLYESALADFVDYDKGFGETTRRLVKVMKSTDNWSDGLAKTTGVFVAPVVLDLINAQPKPRLKIVTGEVHVDFFKEGFDGVNIERKINDDKDFAFLASPQFAPFIDTDLPRVKGVAEIRYYRLTFLKADKEVGVVSATEWIAFAG